MYSAESSVALSRARSSHRVAWRRFGVSLFAALGLGCGAPAKPAASVTEKKAVSFACPVLRKADAPAGLDVAAAFGVDATLAARVERMVSLLAELEDTAQSLEREARYVCSTIARDLDPKGAQVTGSTHPCEVAVQRLTALERALPNGLSVRVAEFSCEVPKDALARCAGECITGKIGVESAVECAAGSSCGLDFTLPDASPQCLTQCNARALRAVSCRAEVDVDLGDSGALDAERVQALRRDLPRLIALGRGLGPRAVALGGTVKELVDELAASLDELTSRAKQAKDDKTTPLIDRRLITAAVLAGCVAPALADTLRASAALEGSISGAVNLHTAIMR